jgi:4-amino-4-deoxy-L-arabinose transferase-like glycosyltransferase
MLRAAEFIRNGTYPADEKRPPFFSLLLATNPNIDQVLWGRLVVLGLSILSFLVFEQVCKELLTDADAKLAEKRTNIALLLFTFNPVIFYWSLRIMSDVLFMLLVLTVFWQYLMYRRTGSLFNLLFSGFIAGLSVLTRFEGYILVGSLGLGIFLHNPRNFKKPILFGLVALLLVGPYLYLRNPLTSTYFEEPGGRKYDFEMIMIYLSSLLYSFGAVVLPFFIFKSRKYIFGTLKNNYPLLIFLSLELLLVLVWPAAVPRLFVPVLPFLILFASYSLADFKLRLQDRTVFALSYFALFTAYVVLQYFLKLQFLVSTRNDFILIVLVQLALFGIFIFAKIYSLQALYVSAVLWSFFAVNIHKNIFISVKNAGVYASQNLQGNVAYNDVSSVSDWYTNYKGTKTKGFYYNTEKKKNLEYNALAEQNIDYLIITNEHNTTMTLDLEKRPYLELLKEFRYNVNGKDFFTKVIKLRKN